MDPKRILKTAALPAQVAWRSQQIALLFSRHGIAGSLGALGIEVGMRGLTFVGVRKGVNVPLDAVFGRNLARTFIRLGPTFIKLGQVMASRPDMAGEAVSEELKVLFDRVPPVSFGQIQRVIRGELGRKKMKESFRSIDPVPLASASLGQTHRAVLADGTPVILKVQKPGVAKTVRLDLTILEGIMWPAHLIYPKLNLLQVFDDFKSATLREIDYREEAKNIDRFRKNYFSLFKSSDVVFPRYVPDISTKRVIALEPMHGKKVAELRKGSTVARQAASLSLTAVLEQIFDHGFFHADPHAGNLFFLEEQGQIGFIDLGLVGHLDPADKRKFLKVLLAVLKRDRKQLAKALYELGTPGKKTKFDVFEKEIQALLDEMKQTGPDNVRLDETVNRLLQIARKNGVHVPNRYVMMMRSCLLIEGVAKSLDPQLSLFKVATPIVAKSLMKSYNPLNIFRRLIP